MKNFTIGCMLLSCVFFTTRIVAQVASITWPLTSTTNPNTPIGNIQGAPESIGAGPAPAMSILSYNNGQRLWVGLTGWTAGALDYTRYIQFDASPIAGNTFTVTDLSFHYGDNPLPINVNVLKFQAYYSTDHWTTSTVLNGTPLFYLNTAMSAFTVSNLNVIVASGQTFSLRIYPFAPMGSAATGPSFAIHDTVVINGTTKGTLSTTGSISGTKFNDLNGNGIQDPGEPGLANWIITLSYAQATGPVTLTDTTDANGNYSFTNLQPGGTYTVSETQQPSWTQTYPPAPGTYSIALTSGQHQDSLNFGNHRVPKPGCVTPPDSMVAWWTLDETSGSIVNDLAGFNNFGTRINGPLSAPGKVSGALQFDGINDYVQVPDHPELNFGTGDFSVDAWVKTTNTTGITMIVDKQTLNGYVYQGYSFYLTNGWLSVQLADGVAPNYFTNYATLVFVADGNWHHVAVTVSRAAHNGIVFYRDGVATPLGDPTVRPGSLTSKSPLTIGRQSFADRYEFQGMLDEIELFDRVLTKAEIVSIFAADSAGKCKPALTTGSIGGMKFNDFNGNGRQDPGEPGLPNWHIGLNISTIPSVLTDSLGNYRFNNLPAGTYTVSETNQTGWVQTAPSAPGTYTVTLAGGQSIDTLIFGNRRDSCGTKAWTPLGTGMNNGTNGEVWALAVIGTDLYVGGAFTTAGGSTVNHIAKWNGSSWSALIGSNNVNGINGTVTAIAVKGTDLYVGGWFTMAGGIPAENIAKWDGTNWSALGSGLSAAGAINALAVLGNKLYATSYILDPALGGPGNIIAQWDMNLSTWSLFSVMDDYVSVMMPDGTNLYAGGQFTLAGGVPANKIAKWNGTIWSQLGVGTDYFIGGAGLKMIAGKLYVGGRFLQAGGNPANFIAKWNGTVWSYFGSGSNIGMNNEVEGLTAMGTDLYASGSFTTAEGVFANSVAKWDGTNWSPLGSGMNDGVWRLAAIGNDLYAGGIFTTAGGASANYIAKYSCSVVTSVDEDDIGTAVPNNFILEQNYPNPFNPSSTIRFAIPKVSFVKISVFDILGREIKVLLNEEKRPGRYDVIFNAKELSSGIYYYTIRAGNFTQTKTMILEK